MTIIDLMDKSKAASVRTFTGGRDGAGGTLVNHVCLSMAMASVRLFSAPLEVL